MYNYLVQPTEIFINIPFYAEFRVTFDRSWQSLEVNWNIFHSKFIPHVETLWWMDKKKIKKCVSMRQINNYDKLSHPVIDLPIGNMKFLKATGSRNQFSEIKMIQKRSFLSCVATAKISESCCCWHSDLRKIGLTEYFPFGKKTRKTTRSVLLLSLNYKGTTEWTDIFTRKSRNTALST
jgi:hypothetical protein